MDEITAKNSHTRLAMVLVHGWWCTRAMVAHNDLKWVALLALRVRKREIKWISYCGCKSIKFSIAQCLNVSVDNDYFSRILKGATIFFLSVRENPEDCVLERTQLAHLIGSWGVFKVSTVYYSVQAGGYVDVQTGSHIGSRHIGSHT